MSGNVQAFRIVLWENEDLHAPPGHVTRRISVSKLVSATLNWNIQMESGVSFNDIRFNNSIISNRNQGSADVTHLLVVNGDNTVTVNYSAWFNWWGSRARGNLDLVIVGSTASIQAPNTTYSLSSLPWWVYGLMALVVCAVVFWWLTQTKSGKKAADFSVDMGGKIGGVATKALGAL